MFESAYPVMHYAYMLYLVGSISHMVSTVSCSLSRIIDSVVQNI